MSIFDSVPSRKLVTQTFEPTKIPDRVVADADRVADRLWPTRGRPLHRVVARVGDPGELGPSEMPCASLPTGIVAVGCSVGVGLQALELVARGVDDPDGALAGGDLVGVGADRDGVAHELVARRVDLLQRPVLGVGDEDVVAVDGDAVGAVADRDGVRRPAAGGCRGRLRLAWPSRRAAARPRACAVLAAAEHAGGAERGDGERGQQQHGERDEQRDAAPARPAGRAGRPASARGPARRRSGRGAVRRRRARRRAAAACAAPACRAPRRGAAAASPVATLPAGAGAGSPCSAAHAARARSPAEA